MNATTTTAVTLTGGRRQSSSGLFEPLEARQLFAVTLSGGTLRITGTDQPDVITVKPRDGRLVVDVNGKRQAFVTSKVKSIAIDARRDDDYVIVSALVRKLTVMKGGDGADTLYAGGGRTQMLGGAGNDTLVSIGGSTADRLAGGEGSDTFWQDGDLSETNDADWDEASAGQQHLVESFYTYRFADASQEYDPVPVDKSRDGDKLPEPMRDEDAPPTDLVNFSHNPLFGADGPSPDDIRQGGIGDCYLLSTLSSIAKTDPALIRQSVVSLGDGTYAVELWNDDGPVHVRVDADMHTRMDNGKLYYAGLGQNGNIWASIIEKAYAFVRKDQGSYGSLEHGWMTEVYEALGCQPDSKAKADLEDGDALLAYIDSLLKEGRSVTYVTGDIEQPWLLQANHAYLVDRLITDEFGHLIGVVLRNPWGKDGSVVLDQNPNDGYVAVAGGYLLEVMQVVQSAHV